MSNEYKAALQRFVDTFQKHRAYSHAGLAALQAEIGYQVESAKALLARPEPDIEDEVNEGVWQLKLEGDRQDAAVFEAFGSFEPAAAEKPSTKYCCFEDCDQEAVYCAGHVEDEKRIAVEQYQIRQAAAAEKARELVHEDELPEIIDEVHAIWLRASRIVDGIRMGPTVPEWLLAYPPAATGEKHHQLCSDCPPQGYPTDKTRCAECPRGAK